MSDNYQKVIYDLLTEVRDDVKDIRKETRQELDDLRTQFNRSKGFIAGLSVVVTLIVGFLKELVHKVWN